MEGKSLWQWKIHLHGLVGRISTTQSDVFGKGYLHNTGRMNLHDTGKCISRTLEMHFHDTGRRTSSTLEDVSP
ncbi:hypothetical protein XENTR_v10003164 [Xenopus tropicalis]|nr:hypothetical protein XENTR_v10003164 [Xenopus tropicalis]